MDGHRRRLAAVNVQGDWLYPGAMPHPEPEAAGRANLGRGKGFDFPNLERTLVHNEDWIAGVSILESLLELRDTALIELVDIRLTRATPESPIASPGN